MLIVMEICRLNERHFRARRPRAAAADFYACDAMGVLYDRTDPEPRAQVNIRPPDRGRRVF